MEKAVKFGKIMNFFMNVVMGIILPVTCMTVMHGFNWVGFFMNFIVSLGVGYTYGDIIPALDYGMALAAKLGVKNRVAAHCISTAVLSFIMITLISITCQFAGMGPDFIHVWPKLYPYCLVVGYIAITALLPFGMKIASAMTGFHPGE